MYLADWPCYPLENCEKAERIVTNDIGNVIVELGNAQWRKVKQIQTMLRGVKSLTNVIVELDRVDASSNCSPWKYLTYLRLSMIINCGQPPGHLSP